MSDRKRLSLAAGAGFERYRNPTRRYLLPAEMERVVPWAALVALIEPHYPEQTTAGGRPPVSVERLLRMRFVQHWFDLASIRRTPAYAAMRLDSAAAGV
jgi:IS5 family transposase